MLIRTKQLYEILFIYTDGFALISELMRPPGSLLTLPKMSLRQLIPESAERMHKGGSG